MNTIVYVTASFPGYHRWKEAPEQVKFLRHFHRHVFHVRLAVHVDHADRDVEFFILKAHLNAILDAEWKDRRFEASCEMIAEDIINHVEDHTGLRVHSCEVNEDNENGAIVFGDTDVPQLVAERLRLKPFVGIEAEGPMRGAKVLFIPGGATVVQAGAAFINSMGDEIAGVYYGAGNDRRLNAETYQCVTEDATEHKLFVTVEGELPELTKLAEHKAPNHLFVCYVLDINKTMVMPKFVDYLKYIADGRIYWINRHDTEQTFITAMNDPYFQADKEI